jgi:MFS transporter, UMF1 family
MIRKRKGIIAWCIYDWANSAFPTVIMTFVFSTYFTKSVAKNTFLGTAQWGHAVALAGIIIAMTSPIFGAVADHQGRRKPWLAFFTLVCIVASAMLWYTKPHVSDVTWALSWSVLGIIGFEIGMVFYNAMLSDLAPKNYLGRISGWAWGLGYFGGLASLLIVLFVFIDGHGLWLHLNIKTAEQIRINGPFVALWFILFAWPLFLWTPDRSPTGIPCKTALFKGFKSLYQTLLEVRKNKEILKFLLSRIFYIDGLNTIFAFGGIYAAGTFGMTFAEVIQFGIAMNIAAGLGAIGFAWLDDYKGAKLTVLISLVIMIICGSTMLLVHSKLLFWIFGMGLSLCVGPVQAASRSLMVRLSPKHLVTELFGLYAFSGKATAFLGPWILGTVTLAFNSQRIGMSIVMVFLLIGGLILTRVKEV